MAQTGTLPSLVVISGPTASGKTDFALELSARCPAEIVNADSVQVYRDFDIGSSKPSREQSERVAHHLLSVVSPDAEFDVGEYRQMALDAIESIQSRGKVPFLVGGSGLYIRTVLCGLVEAGKPTEGAREEVRAREEELRERCQLESEVSLEMHSWLSSLDPKSAERIRAQDLHRIRRAILVNLSTGLSLAELHDRHQNQQRPFRALVIVLFPERSKLYQAIDLRVERMLEQGFIDEVSRLRQGYPLSSRPFTAIGYRHIGCFLDGEIHYPEMVDLLKRDTRRFAKRQMTWWRNQSRRLGWCTISEDTQTDLQAISASGICVALGEVVNRFLQEKSEFRGEKIWYCPVENVQGRCNSLND